MSFQAYLTNIEAKTGKGPDDFRAWAAAKGWAADGKLVAGVKAGTITDALKAEFELGHGHAMAIYALLKGMKKEGDA
ncbi:DUF4287 domain-containing protein [Sphingomonas sp. AOB5]|uniref:DUF4287 domain-containing protein n=1 Tax=Sphingomonas sp. AOB5 TaxID=3034017 RepID=UPI0023F8BDE8|nr:DUF4287 domain-containing protein [Sphingomonas sp. AOB5]MDF7776785.1 DUF4287 domain-containing protein [Sphingomonas sp. AOB5]